MIWVEEEMADCFRGNPVRKVCILRSAYFMKLSVSFSLLLCFCVFGVRPETRIAFTPYEEAKPILETLAEIIPAELRDARAGTREEVWNAWVIKRDKEIRARLAQGDADSVVNFLMFGTSFTSAPRLNGEQIRALTTGMHETRENHDAASGRALLERREFDLAQGMMAPRGNERLDFARKTIEGERINFSQPEALQKAQEYLRENVERVLREQAGFEQAMLEAKNLNDATEEFAEISKLYKDRGLSLDTSMPPNFAIEEALRDMREKGLLAKDSIKRIGVIGPGLDFTDKHEGYDFYSVQTVQPFAVADTLVRLGLAEADALKVDVLDLSPRILRHTEQMADAAKQGRGYVIQLPMNPARGWQPQLVDYWKHFGDQIGDVAKPTAVPRTLQGIRLRAVRVRPQYARQMKAYDVNVVLQRAEFLGDEEKFDLLIATNILVYYDTFEQSLALGNIAAMLKPGGFLLTNNLLLELPGSPLKSMGHTAIQYSAAQADGDTIVRYGRIR